MTAALDRVGDALTARPATVFFDALRAADEHLRRDEQQAWEATFAPPVRTFAICPCGSTFEARDDQIQLTAEEEAAAAERLADLFGRGPLDELDQRIIVSVIDAINHERAHAAWDDQSNWNDAHQDCGADW